MLLPLQGTLPIAITPRAMPWAKSFCPFRACCLHGVHLIPFLPETLGYGRIVVIVLCPETRTSGKRVVFLKERTKMPVGRGVVVLALATDAHSLARR